LYDAGSAQRSNEQWTDCLLNGRPLNRSDPIPGRPDGRNR